MGVPALFRWLSKKYPKIILPVIEAPETTFDDDGKAITIPVDTTQPNPNGEEFDNLYLDMNGIVHPCTHPEGKPAPETEEEMMVEVFNYTERVVNMIRPRKLLMIAIDGVAPRAKMNQQRSRRFRSSQEANEKEEARKESLELWEGMGKTVTDEMRSKKAWDSNAITPGTPFMDLLASSLRYWIVKKMNLDPAWKQLEVIISDASVPGEGEHKIMDFIRRQRTHPGHDPNTRHVIYGLDADLIMLSLATHEPYFRVLREDVFFQDTSPTACRICNQEGHYAAQCTGEKKIKADENDTKSAPVTKKPFIFLDVSILREYLEIELNIPNAPFPFDIERAIDDWVLLIFFVGNDFLPHLPSLEIREGAIDTLLKIWKDELPKMGGYVTNHGKLDFNSAGIILDGLAKREDDIFRRRHEAEMRQDQNAKRRKMEASMRFSAPVIPAASLQLTGVPSAPPALQSPHGLPPRPNFDSFENTANSMGFGTPASTSSDARVAAVAAMMGSASDYVDNRRQIRMANLSAAEMLKAEMMSAVPVNPAARKKHEAQLRAATMQVDIVAKTVTPPPTEPPSSQPLDQSQDISEQDEQPVTSESAAESNQLQEPTLIVEDTVPNEGSSPQGVKRKSDDLEDAEGEDDETFDLGPDDEEDDASKYALKVNPDGTVVQEDQVRLYEPGYKERYYRHKFGVEHNDEEFKKKLTMKYIEGMAWVLQYYYQGTPSWTWFYPYHFAPFAGDFVEVSKMDVSFNLGQPFKPFEQLMGVFPPASRHHIPEVFHMLMTDPDSPIIDFYPETFSIDMNGKKMAWQGVALLPFIDERRLLDAMQLRYKDLSEDEVRRNKWGNNVLFVADEHPLYPSLEGLYAKRKNKTPVPIDPKQGKGLHGSLLPDPSCVPGSTFESPLTSQGLEDISGDCSLAALYFFPKQLFPHRSMLLPGVRRPPRVLEKDDIETIKWGGRGRGRGRGAGFHSINNGWEGGGRPQRGGYGADGQAYGIYRARDNRSGSGFGTYGNGNSHYGDRSVAPPYGRGDYGRSSYGGPPDRSSYQPSPANSYDRSSNYYQGGGARAYSRQPPSSSSAYGGPPPASRYDSGRAGYESYNNPSSYSTTYINSQGYGDGTRNGYGGYGGYGAGGGGNSSYGGYGGDRSATSRGGSVHGGGRGGSGGQYNPNQGNYGGYGRGTPQYSSSYTGRGRGYGRY